MGNGHQVDILYGIPLPPSQVDRLAAIGQQLGQGTIFVMIDRTSQLGHVARFAEQTSFPAGVYLKINTGYHRAGSPPSGLNKNDLASKFIVTFCASVCTLYIHCPFSQTCSVSGYDPGNWTVYHDIQTLITRKEPMLLDCSIHNKVDDPGKSLSLFACNGMLANQTTTCSSQAARYAAFYLSQIDCNSDTASMVFGYLQGSYVGVYSGAQMHSQAVMDLIMKFTDSIQEELKGDFQIMQICGPNRTADYVVGIAAAVPSAVGDLTALASVQDAVRTWSQGQCATGFPLSPTSTSSIKTMEKRFTLSTRHLSPRTNRKTTQVVSGDSCASLAKKSGISAANFAKYNPSKTLCSTLAVGQYVCCSSGNLPDMTPKPNSNGSCASYLIKSGDFCSSIAASHSITVANIESCNKKTWGWMGCDDLPAQINICLSTGTPPLPASVANAQCGPQVPGTKKPTGSQTLTSLNPCILNVCCDKWGQCGITDDFCTQVNSSSGAPGTSKAGTNGCISNCGSDIVSGTALKNFMKLGYYESWQKDPSCLRMDVESLQGYDYTVVHFAFANISETYDVDISTVKAGFEIFANWSFSTALDSYPIFRTAVTEANRQKFANNVVAFVIKYGLDGADFDWEYPGMRDAGDGDRYLPFLSSLKNMMPAGTTVSIAAPASFWYLKGFPIAKMSKILDYIVYITYDLHGQWDYINAWANPGCPTGNCLRSHVNRTETLQALALITKARVPSSKVIVGLASYGRSFKMTNAKCTGPTCTFTGPDSGATPGKCTAVARYISIAEINDLVATGNATTHYDEISDSNIAVYGQNWVGYINSSVLGGTTNWAVDLKEFLLSYDPNNDGRWSNSSADASWTLAVDAWNGLSHFSITF
ncbi:chitinase [Trichoderma chlorosporum]